MRVQLERFTCDNCEKVAETPASSDAFTLPPGWFFVTSATGKVSHCCDAKCAGILLKKAKGDQQ